METGLKHVSTVTVSAANTALTMGSGDMEVFATPAMVALMENAAMKAVAPHLPEGSTTVGAIWKHRISSHQLWEKQSMRKLYLKK